MVKKKHMNINWTRWMTKKDLSEIEKKPGVYQFRLVDRKGEQFQIKRFVKIDAGGIILYGSSSNLNGRINGFFKAMKGEKSRHSEGERFYRIKKIVKQVYENYNLQYSYKYNSKEECKKLEKSLIQAYFKKRCERPPLNRKLG